MARRARCADHRARPGARPVHPRCAAGACATQRRQLATVDGDAVCQQHRARKAAAVPRRPGDGAAHHGDDPLECAGDGDARQPRQSGARPSSAATSRAMPRLPRSSRSASTTSSAPRRGPDGRSARRSHHIRRRPGAAGLLGDLVFFQPHSAPGVYARAYLEGRLSADELAHYRQEMVAPARGPAAPIRIRG